MVRGNVIFYVLRARVLGRAPREALGQVRGPLTILVQEILYSQSRPEKFQATGVEIERQKRRGRRPTAMCRSEGRVAKKRFRTIPTWNHVQSSPTTTWVRVTPGIFFRHELPKDLLLQILYNPAGVESLLVILRAPRPAAPPRVPRS